MLKERIDYLCYKKGISRKELTDGLITQAHFSNILAGRYPLPEDLAAAMAERLAVATDDLLLVDQDSPEVLQQAEHIFEQLTVQASAIPESLIDELEDRHPALTIELTTALMKATYYQQMNDKDAYDYLHQSYLNFYLERFGKPDEVQLPLPLVKALLFYKIQYFRSKEQYFDVLHQVRRWLELVDGHTETWLTGQQIQMEAYVHTRQFEHAKKSFERITAYIYEKRMFHRLSGMYVLYSGYCFWLEWYEEALTALSMAEAHLVYAQQQSDTLSAIMNNRIVMLTMNRQLEQAEEEIARFRDIVNQQPVDTAARMEPALLIYECEVALTRKDWTRLLEKLTLLRTHACSEDQEMALLFYDSQMALAQGQIDSFNEYALACLPYFEQIRQKQRLEILYEALAATAEEQRRYKEAALYYRKLVYLLRHA